MGNQSRTEDKLKFLDDFDKMYKKEKVLQDSRFGEITIYSQNSQIKLFMYIQYQIREKLLPQRVWLNNRLLQSGAKLEVMQYTKVLFDILDTIWSKRDNYVSSKIRSNFSRNFRTKPYKKNWMQGCLQNFTIRIPNQQYFPEQDVWLLTYQIIQAQIELLNAGLFCGDVRPQNIMLTANGEVKLIVVQFQQQQDSSLLPSKQTAYLRFIKDNQNVVILSPEELFLMNQNVQRLLYDQEKSDVYCLGLMLLQVCNLVPTGCYHDYKAKTLRLEIIQSNLGFVEKVYSKFLTNFISLCIDDQVGSRPNFNDLQVSVYSLYQSILSPYEKQIKQNTEFFPTKQVSQDSLSKSPMSRSPINRNQTKAYFHTPKSSHIKTPEKQQSDNKQDANSKQEINKFSPQIDEQKKPPQQKFDPQTQGQLQNHQIQHQNNATTDHNQVKAKRESFNYYQNKEISNPNMQSNNPTIGSQPYSMKIDNQKILQNGHQTSYTNLTNAQAFDVNWKQKTQTGRSISPLGNAKLQFDHLGANNVEKKSPQDLKKLEFESQQLDERVRLALAQSQQTLQRSNLFMRR